MAVEQDFIEGSLLIITSHFPVSQTTFCEGKYHPALIHLPFVANDLWSFSTKNQTGNIFLLFSKTGDSSTSSSELFSSRERPFQTEGVILPLLIFWQSCYRWNDCHNLLYGCKVGGSHTCLYSSCATWNPRILKQPGK